MSTLCAKPQSALTAALQSALFITLGHTLPQLLVTDLTEHPRTRLWHTGSLNGPLEAPASSQAASHDVTAHAPQLTRLACQTQQFCPLHIAWHMQWRDGVGQGGQCWHTGLFSQGPAPSVGNLATELIKENRKL